MSSAALPQRFCRNLAFWSRSGRRKSEYLGRIVREDQLGNDQHDRFGRELLCGRRADERQNKERGAQPSPGACGSAPDDATRTVACVKHLVTPVGVATYVS
jgi:hypothetical protein